jgi:HEAT repeat protein
MVDALLQIYADAADAPADEYIDEMYARARKELKKRPETAFATLILALVQNHAPEESYLRVVQLLGTICRDRNLPRQALTLAWYTGDVATQRALLHLVPLGDRGRTIARWAEAAREPATRQTLHARAAAELEQAGFLVRSAIQYERSDSHVAARALWSRLAELLDGQAGEEYAAGLARFNLARMSRKAGDDRAAHAATVAAVHRLEAAADHFEAVGQRERAFDCFHVLIAIGVLTGTFEHVLEGSVNAIRILSEDNLRQHALSMYETALASAAESNEHAAAATLAREMTEYARKQGLGRIAARGMQRQAELWEQVAETALGRDAPAELAENALIASLLARAEAGQYGKVGGLYGRLAELDLDRSRCEHYARVKLRYQNVADAALEATPHDARPGEYVAPPDVWHVDLLEWEEQGAAAEVCADVVLDAEENTDRITRRSALLGRLVALTAETQTGSAAAHAGILLARHLAPIGLYSVLAALERLYRSPDSEVRQAAVAALGRYFYKRTFVTLERALRDPSDKVVTEATTALGRLHFAHAFDPLARIFRATVTPKIRQAALRTISKIDVVEAAELLLGVLDHGGPEERKIAIAELRIGRGLHFAEVARAAYPQASKRLKTAIDEVFASRSVM